ncbi:hypothetical protein ZIOFF_000968 [Zingiber officinale]|uniref:Polyadenylate-binding protein n=1 Tax=Zingiber officinale TaxID=94328 RepID=A0A8J5M874_ZINOF|nr:hypothetical protein ZIOFF_000968 [Zingiber officinale]
MAQVQIQPHAVVSSPLAAVVSGGTAFQIASTSLYVGDLDLGVTDAHLYDVFSQIGQVVSVRVCRDINTRRSLGYAYVNFSDPADAAKAIEVLNFTLLNGKTIRIMYSNRDPSVRKSGSANIFIKNLDKSIDNKALQDTFSVFGNILSCKIATDPSGHSKGYGFVQFEQEEAAQNAIQKLNGMLMNDKKVFVGPFVRKQEREGAANSAKFNNVFVKNLSESVTEDTLLEVFGEFGKITSCVVMKEGDGKSKCFGFVNFENPEAAAQAVQELDGKKFDDKEWYVGKAQKKSEREQELKEKFAKSKQESTEKFQGVNLYLKNLDDSIGDDSLRELFSGFGTITSCKVMRDNNGKSKGSGFVAFQSPEDASRALSEMNGKMVGSKPLYVAVAQRKEDRRAILQFLSYGYCHLVPLSPQCPMATVILFLYPLSALPYLVMLFYFHHCRQRDDALSFSDHFVLFLALFSALTLLSSSISCSSSAASYANSHTFVYVVKLAQFSQMRPVAMQASIAPRVPLYPPGAPGLGQPLFYGQPPPGLVPQSPFSASVLICAACFRASGAISRIAYLGVAERWFGFLGCGGDNPGFGFQQPLVPGMRHGAAPFPNFFMPMVQQSQQVQRPGGRRVPLGPVHQIQQQPMPMIQQQVLSRGGRPYRYPAGRNMQELPGMAGGMFSVPYDMGAMPLHHSSRERHAMIICFVPIPIQTGFLDFHRTLQFFYFYAQLLGESLYPLVDQLEHDHAAKVTGMLLEMDQTEVLHLLESPEALSAKVAEAMEVLRSVAQQQQQDFPPVDRLATLSLNNVVS